MLANTGNHKLSPEKPDAIYITSGYSACQIRLGEIDVDLSSSLQVLPDHSRGFYPCVAGYPSLIDPALKTVHRDQLLLPQHLCCIAGSHYTGHSQLPGDDSGMTGPAAAVGNDGCCPLHGRDEVRSCHLSYQDLAAL